MKGQPHRLNSDGRTPFGGASIDRSRPLKFRLNGMTISGFAGDTVLSAALASGIDTAGTYQGWPLALSHSFAPAIAPTESDKDGAQRAMPMARVPATDGADFRTLGPRKRRPISDAVERLAGLPRSLGLDLDAAGGLDQPWLTVEAQVAPRSDLVVVGGGVAGLAAAVAAADAGCSVILLEATSELGGHARLFGTQDGEEAPDDTIRRLVEAVRSRSSIAVHLLSEAFAVRQGIVRAHLVTLAEGHPVGRVVDFPTGNIVLATGTVEQLPVFPGNRLPGVTGAAEAYLLAHRFAVWPGRSAVLATVSSPAYRLAMQAKDSAVDVLRVLDGRSDPQSRFVAFSKAYGITMASGTVPAAALPHAKGKSLTVRPQIALGSLTRDEAELTPDRLVVCGGWQPDLTLWHMAGGESRWEPASWRIDPRGTLAAIVHAGSAAGLLTRKASIQSGQAAVARLLGRHAAPVVDELIDPIYETPDGPAPMAERSEEQPPAFLGSGRSLLQRPVGTAKRRPRWLSFVGRPSGWQLAETPHPLEVTDIVAGVRLGAIPPDSAGIVAQERVAMVPLQAQAVAAPVAASDDLVPAYLRGRFGPQTALWIVASVDRRHLDTGALIFSNADNADPLLAVGVVVRRGDGAAMALLGGSEHQPDTQLTLRDGERPIGIRLVAPFSAGMKLVASLGSETRPA